MPCRNPYFYSVFWVRAFWAKLSKKGSFGHPPKKKNLTDNWKALFWGIFVIFTFSFFFCFLFSCFCCCFFLDLFFCSFFGGFKGQVRRPEGPPHLALNSPYFFSVLFCFCLVFCFFWRVSGSGEVARRATSLGPKPSLFLFFCFPFLLCF